MLKNLVLVLKTNQEFIRYSDNYAKKNEIMLSRLFENMSDTYIPLLNMFRTLEQDNVKFKMGLVLSPVLCAMLENPSVQELYVEWLEKRIQLGTDELENNKGETEKLQLIEKLVSKYTQLKSDFENIYNKKLIPVFAEYHQKGLLELIATCGTDVFVPHYGDLPEVISAQIEIGLQSFRYSFGDSPDGFWLPDLGYTPGVEKLIRGYGYSYTILDARSMLLCENVPSNGIFYPCRFEDSLACFGADPFLEEEIFGEEGYAANEVYRNENCDIGFELPLEQLKSVISEGASRYATGFKYWNKASDDSDRTLYNPCDAEAQVLKDAEAFLKAKSQLLSSAAEKVGDSDFVSLVCTLDADKLHANWCEAIKWIENIFRNAAAYDVNLANCNELLEKQFSLEKVSPYYSAAIGTGYGENLISSRNSWMMRYIRKACERMIDLADRFPNDTGLKTRLLNIGAKQLMIAQSSGLQKMIDNQEFPEYAEKRFEESICDFTAVFDSLGSNKVSTEWLTTLESLDNIFPWMNYRIYSKKK